MASPLLCAQCGSDDIVVFQRRGEQECQDCGHRWPAAPRETAAGPEVTLSTADTEGAWQFCQQLAATADWVETVATAWPSPIAHEYHRLRELLAAGQIIGAIFQLKDFAEVLIKLPAVALAQAVLAGDAAPELQDAVRRALLAKPLSFGDWRALAGDTLAPPLCGADGLTGALARLFRQPGRGKPGETELHRLLRELVAWRNDTLGHGALRLQVSEFQPELEAYITRLNTQLREHQAVWGDSRLEDEAGTLFQGWPAIRRRHEEQVPGPHVSADLDLYLVTGSRRLRLSPLLTLRRCRVCDRQDVFFFDSRAGQPERRQLYFIVSVC